MFSRFSLLKRHFDRRALAAVAVGAAAAGFVTYAAIAAYHGQTRVIYSLDARRNDEEIVQLIDDARRYVYFAIYTFTKDDIADALVRAKRRGVVVWGITDRGQAAEDFEAPVVGRLRAAGIPVETQKHADGIMHAKALVTEKAYASGSYNWTESATDANDELLEIGTDPSVRAQYLAALQKILVANR